jgi:hypothetical protein
VKGLMRLALVFQSSSSTPNIVEIIQICKTKVRNLSQVIQKIRRAQIRIFQIASPPALQYPYRILVGFVLEFPRVFIH